MIVELRPFDRVDEDFVGMDNVFKMFDITCLLIVRVITLGKVAKNPVNGIRVCIWADLQNFVVIYKAVVIHSVVL
jgi:hypothetical protein